MEISKKKKHSKKKSSGSTGKAQNHHHVTPMCDCGVSAAGPRSSKTRKNSGRQYFSCGNIVGKKAKKNQRNCDFVLWVEQE